MCDGNFHGLRREVERKKMARCILSTASVGFVLLVSDPGVQGPAVLRFTAIEELARAPGPLHLALGVFDGVHLGHQAVIGQALAARERQGGSCGVLTFDPYPIRVLFPEKAPRRLLASLDHKAEILAALGVDFMLALPFDRYRAAQPAEDFVREIAAAGVKTVAVGIDWRFGRGRQGDAAVLAGLAGELGFRLEALPPVMMDGERISSTRIRQAIRDGNLDNAARMLGRPYTIEGRVVEGQRLGRTIGFPTANVAVGPELLMPADGIYAGELERADGQVLPAAIYIGHRPTFYDDGAAVLLEVHVLDFDGDLYGERVAVRFVHRIRGDATFDDVDALAAQLAVDCDDARRLMGG
jgi:riboflavin kinase/FMN adenylyltransferase